MKVRKGYQTAAIIHVVLVGALLYPYDAIININMNNYLVINKLTEHLMELTKTLNSRNVAVEITLNVRWIMWPCSL